MSIDLRAFTSTGDQIGSSLVVTPPSAQSGDIIILELGTDFLNVTVTSAPSGFTLITSQSHSNTNEILRLYYKVSDGNEPASYTFVMDAQFFPNNIRSQCIALSYYHSGASSLGIGAFVGQSNAAGNYTWPSVTPAETTESLLMCFATRESSALFTPDAAMTEVYDLDQATAISPYLMTQQLLNAQSGVATGTRTATLVGAGTRQCVMISLLLIVVAPDDGPPYRVFYAGTEITAYCYAAAMEAKLKSIESNTFVTDLHKEWMAGLARWEVACSGWWDKVSDDLLGADMVNGSPDRQVEVRIRGRGTIYVRYIWTTGNIYLYNLPAILRGAIEFNANLILSGPPERSILS